LVKKIIIVKNSTAYTWDWYCQLVVDKASFVSFVLQIFVIHAKIRIGELEAEEILLKEKWKNGNEEERNRKKNRKVGEKCKKETRKERKN
jgi:hypothetical protein